ncbi:MAG: mannosyltransferase family protein [Candidatus Limnocylindria bacterium]
MSAARGVLVPFLFSRLLVAVVALAAAALFPPAAVCRDACHASSIPLLDVAARWDADPYLAIARDGYGADAPSHVAYFPLYPFLMRMGGAMFGGDDAYLAAGLVISNLALFAALVYLVRSVVLDHDAATATRAAVFLLVFPTTVFLSAVYPESLFLLLAVAATYHARRREWLLAGALAALAALTRPFGAVVALPLAMEALRRPVAFRGLASSLIAPATFFGWLAVLWLITGDPRALLTAQAQWGVQAGLSLQVFADLLDPAVYGFPYFVFAFTVVIGALVAISWRVLRPSLAAYATVVFLVAISGGSLTSAPRYYLAVFPAFIALALIAPGWLGRTYVALAAVIGTVLTAMFALWYWIG